MKNLSTTFVFVTLAASGITGFTACTTAPIANQSVTPSRTPASLACKPSHIEVDILQAFSVPAEDSAVVQSDAGIVCSFHSHSKKTLAVSPQMVAMKASYWDWAASWNTESGELAVDCGGTGLASVTLAGRSDDGKTNYNRWQPDTLDLLNRAFAGRLRFRPTETQCPKPPKTHWPRPGEWR